MDPITLQRIELLHPNLRAEARKIYEEICDVLSGRALCRFTHTYRSLKEQAAIYALGRTKPGRRVTNAGPGNSFHNYGLAIDFCLIIDGKTACWDTVQDFDADQIADWMEVVAVFEKYGWEWGGRWQRFIDRPHFQKTFGHSTAQLKSKLTATSVYPAI